MKKTSIEFIRESLSKEKYELLSTEFIDRHTKLQYICEKGHIRGFTWESWSAGGRCRICANERLSAARRLDFSEVEKSFKDEGYSIIKCDYINASSKIHYVCDKGHEHTVTWRDWYSGNRCPKCSKERRKMDINFIKESFEKEDYVLLATTYENSHQKLHYRCPKGNEYYMSWNSWQRGKRCPCCNSKARLTIEFVRAEFKKEKYTLLTTEYENHNQKLDYRCKRGHEHSITWGNWHTGCRCPECSRIEVAEKQRLSYDFVRDSFKAEEYTLLSTEYINANTKLDYMCKKGHKRSITWGGWYSGNRCPKCTNNGTSRQEQSVAAFVKGLGLDVIENDRSIIAPKELDIVLPDLKIAIEYCGLYWHSELSNKDRKYHLNKLNGCSEKGFKLITIFEDELLYRKPILESVLKNKLGVFDGTKVYARSCIVKEISAGGARTFCDENHLQGYSDSSIKLGLFHNEDLVSVMTFAKQSIAKGRKHVEGHWELSRFCNKIDHSIIGGASKLLKHFERNFDWCSIISYADRRWSDGNLYSKLGFGLDKTTAPNYWYFKEDEMRRIHRFALRKKYDEPKNITEWVLRQAQGFNRIWDCGNLRYVKNSN